MPCDYKKYPADWKQIRARILERDGHRCKFCGVPNYTLVMTINGIRMPHYESFASYKEAKAYRDRRTSVYHPIVVLTIAHLNHDTTDNRDEVLAALCQRCHLEHDKYLHATNARGTRQRKRYGEDNGEDLFF